MPTVNLLDHADLKGCVRIDSLSIDCIENCFNALGSENVIMPPIMRLDIKEFNGEVDVKTAYLPNFDSFAIKISPGFFDNPKIGLPSVSGMMVLFSAKTGQLESVLLDKGYLTNIRTAAAAAGAVAAKWLARPNSRYAAIIGAGVQAGLQLKALTQVRDIHNCVVWARSPNKSQTFADQMGDELGIPIEVANSPSAACADADIIVTTTPSTEPLIHFQDLKTGQHLTAMGSDAEHKNELAPDVVSNVDRYICDRLSQVRASGELHHAIDAGEVEADVSFDELGQVVCGKIVGREHDNQITLCDLTGTGAQDTAIATFACQQAVLAGIGSLL